MISKFLLSWGFLKDLNTILLECFCRDFQNNSLTNISSPLNPPASVTIMYALLSLMSSDIVFVILLFVLVYLAELFRVDYVMFIPFAFICSRLVCRLLFTIFLFFFGFHLCTLSILLLSYIPSVLVC